MYSREDDRDLMRKRDFTKIELVENVPSIDLDGRYSLGTYCCSCGAFLAPTGAPESVRINKALEHIDVCPGKPVGE